MSKKNKQKLQEKAQEHKRHLGLLAFAVALILVLLVLKGEHLTWAVIGARLLRNLSRFGN